jgi:hypothetical protein
MPAGAIADSPSLFLPASGLVASTTNNEAQTFLLGLSPQRDVGYVTRDKCVPVYLWNGTTSPATLTNIDISGDVDGIAWDTVLPIVVEIKRSLRVIITVGVDGPLTFVSNIAFIASCITTYLTIIGTRAPQLLGDIGYLFMPHDWSNGLTEEVEWKTDVLIAFNRTEQRIALRTMPRRSWTLSLLVSDEIRRKLEAWVGMRIVRYLVVPMWQHSVILENAITAGDSVVYLDNDHGNYVSGTWLAVWDEWDHCELKYVQGGGANYVSLEAPFDLSWPAHTSTVGPVRVCHCLNQRDIKRITDTTAVITLPLMAKGDLWNPTGDTVDIYKGIPVCPFWPNWVDPSETLNNKWVALDNDTGVLNYDIQGIEPVISKELKFLLSGRQDIMTFTAFLYSLVGMREPWWVPALDQGFELAITAPLGQNFIVISPMDYASQLLDSEARSYIHIELVDGTIIREEVLSVETLPSFEEKLFLANPLSVEVSVSNILRSTWLEKVRLSDDKISFHWISTHILEISLPIVVLP